jgi:1,4-alpha-glucan branching enzyme
VWTKFLAKMIAAVLLPVFMMGCSTASWHRNGVGARGIPVRFLYVVTRAATVCVAGSFNQWSLQSHCMRREGDTWSITISLPSGRHEYGFVIDGESWQADPGAPLAEDNGFGRMNSVLIVE